MLYNISAYKYGGVQNSRLGGRGKLRFYRWPGGAGISGLCPGSQDKFSPSQKGIFMYYKCNHHVEGAAFSIQGPGTLTFLVSVEDGRKFWTLPNVKVAFVISWMPFTIVMIISMHIRNIWLWGTLNAEARSSSGSENKIENLHYS